MAPHCLYRFTSQVAGGDADTFTCSFSRVWAGDALIAGSYTTPSVASLTPMTLQASVITYSPQTVNPGPLSGETFLNYDSAFKALKTSAGSERITLR